MLEHGALHSLIYGPVGYTGVAPYLERYSVFIGCHQSHEYLLILCDVGVGQEPLAHIGAEEAHVGVECAVDRSVAWVECVIFTPLLAHVVHIWFQYGEHGSHSVDPFVVDAFYGIQFELYGAGYLPVA